MVTNGGYSPTNDHSTGSPGAAASGAWVVAAVFFYNTVLLGYGARWHGVPFLSIPTTSEPNPK